MTVHFCDIFKSEARENREFLNTITRTRDKGNILPAQTEKTE